MGLIQAIVSALKDPAEPINEYLGIATIHNPEKMKMENNLSQLPATDNKRIFRLIKICDVIEVDALPIIYEEEHFIYVETKHHKLDKVHKNSIRELNEDFRRRFLENLDKNLSTPLYFYEKCDNFDSFMNSIKDHFEIPENERIVSRIERDINTSLHNLMMEMSVLSKKRLFTPIEVDLINVVEKFLGSSYEDFRVELEIESAIYNSKLEKSRVIVEDKTKCCENNEIIEEDRKS